MLLTLTLATFSAVNLAKRNTAKKLAEKLAPASKSLLNSQSKTQDNPCGEKESIELTSCVRNFILTEKDPKLSGSMLGFYLAVNEKSIKENTDFIKTLYQKQDVKNKCYDMLLRAGNLAYTIIGEKAFAYDLIICRSVFKVGIYQAQKGMISKNQAIKEFSHLCDQDPEKNGCADGIGRLVYEYGYSFKDASKACAYGETISAKNETFYEGCMGGYGNWSRYAPYFKDYTSINMVRTTYCKGIDIRGFLTCMGYGMRSYVRSGLTNGGYQEKLDEYYQTCMVKPASDIASFCSGYLGFTLADVYNDRSGLGEPLSGKALSSKIDKYCQADQACLSNFISWYINQWAFSNDGKLNIQGSNEVCSNIKIINTKYCFEYINYEVDRYEKRLIKASQE